MNESATEFRPIPAALCDRVCQHAHSLRDARTVPDQIKALFLAHAELKDAEALLPSIEIPNFIEKNRGYRQLPPMVSEPDEV